MASPICFRLLTHWARRAASRAACTAGRSRAIRTAMIAITTSNSMSVKPRLDLVDITGLPSWRMMTIKAPPEREGRTGTGEKSDTERVELTSTDRRAASTARPIPVQEMRSFLRRILHEIFHVLVRLLGLGREIAAG